MLRGILIVVVLFLFSAPAVAQPLSVSNGEDEEVMIFTEGEDLSGASVRPFGEDLSSRSRV